MNCVSLSVIIEFGTPKRWTMSRKNSMACSDLTDGDAALQDLGVASPVELTLNNNKGLGAVR